MGVEEIILFLFPVGIVISSIFFPKVIKKAVEKKEVERLRSREKLVELGEHVKKYVSPLSDKEAIMAYSELERISVDFFDENNNRNLRPIEYQRRIHIAEYLFSDIIPHLKAIKREKTIDILLEDEVSD